MGEFTLESAIEKLQHLGTDERAGTVTPEHYGNRLSEVAGTLLALVCVEMAGAKVPDRQQEVQRRLVEFLSPYAVPGLSPERSYELGVRFLRLVADILEELGAPRSDRPA